MPDPADHALNEQLEYYRARAPEYDEWWLRRGRYDRGAERNAQWSADVALLEQALEDFGPRGNILEFAPGTGLWSQRLRPHATHLTLADGSREMLARAAARLGDPRVRCIQADILSWEPRERYDTVFFSFWLSHVPPERFDDFWRLVRASLAPGGRVFFIDSLYDSHSTAKDHRLPAASSAQLSRRLNDGRTFRIYKIFYEPAQLEERLARGGWSATVRQTPRFFLHGSAR